MNGTLLDTSALDAFFAQHCGAARVRHEWFNELIGLSNVASITRYYEPFPQLADSALVVIGRRYGAKIGEAERAEFKKLMTTLPAFDDVLAALEKLRGAKFKMAVLTNSPKASAQVLLGATDISPFLDAIISVEDFQKYKPDEAVYHGAACALGIPAAEMMLVAAHAWDTTGAIRAGCQAAFLERPGESLPPGAPKPGIIAKDMNDLAEQLCKLHSK